MRNNWIFKTSTYRDAIKHKIGESQGRGYRSLMARAAGCQPAYLSQVMAETAELTPEQASGLCDFWELSDLESDYFLTLVDLGRTTGPGLRERLERKLHRLKKQYEAEKSGSIQIEKENYDREKALLYYLDWVPSAVHVCLMIPGYDHPGTLAKRLRIEEGVALLALNTLVDLRIAERAGGGWRLTSKSLHVADESLFAPNHHRNWREKVTEYFRRGRFANNYHYTAACCLDRATFLQIRAELTRLAEASRNLVLSAPEETVACLNIDWFEI